MRLLCSCAKQHRPSNSGIATKSCADWPTVQLSFVSDSWTTYLQFRMLVKLSPAFNWVEPIGFSIAPTVRSTRYGSNTAFIMSLWLNWILLFNVSCLLTLFFCFEVDAENKSVRVLKLRCNLFLNENGESSFGH